MPVAASHPLHWLIERPIAHRGLHDRSAGRIENSVSAFDAALAHGFAIECDVQLTLDGDAVVFHDFELGRLTEERGDVVSRSTADLGAIALKGSGNDRIPTLEQVVKRIAGRVPLVIEIKSRFVGDLTLAKRVAEIVGPDASAIAIKSFDPAIVACLADALPKVPRGFIGMNSYEHPEFDHLPADQKHAMATLALMPGMQPDFLSWRVADLDDASPLFQRLAPTLPIMSWTVRTEADRALAARFADQMVFEGFLPDRFSAPFSTRFSAHPPA